MSDTNHRILHPRVIGLRGPAGVGKTSTALRFAVLGCAEVHSFAEPMRHGFRCMGIEKDTHPGLYREYLQKVGQGVRAVDPDHWVRQQEDPVRRCLARGRHCIFDDVRYPNEAAICDLVFFVHPEGFAPADLGKYSSHESEQWNQDFYSHPKRHEGTILLLNRYNELNRTIQPILDALAPLVNTPRSPRTPSDPSPSERPATAPAA